MKKQLTLLIFVLALAPTVSAQLIWELNPNGGWRIGGDFRFSADLPGEPQSVDFESGGEFGLNAAVGFTPSFFLEFQWSRQNTTLNPRPPIIVDDHPLMLDVTVDYYHGALLFQYSYDRAQPFGYFSLGATTFYPDKDAFKNSTRFSMGGGAGLKYYLVQRLALRAEIQFITSSMNSESGGFWCDYYGCWSTSRINWFTQWSFTGGLVIRLGGPKRRRW